ncbi:YadA-like family protein [Haemophilus influenzae]|uniref:Adhesin YadA n=1 Tax=Haemophilus influenzae TaxID=727 RepID=A0AB37B8P1_HAEIF|nr:YadA-like family protein [Haemophilus influenzae]PRJ26173.1 Adhesin YadA precursor [Haemophilus influenzae]PRJ68258.1 Adhesin YadA precursor [Haemophilus influenzae]PRM82213.1 Adhesin YadA precursor [Haemophilus influenzae]
MAIGINSQVTPEYNPILVNSTDLKTNYTAELSMALGYGAKALNSDSIAIGQFTEVLGQDSVAMGFGAYIGKQKQTTGEKPTSIYESGFKLESNKTYAELIKPEASNRFNYSTVIGSNAKGFGYHTTAYGAGAEAYGTHSLSLGIASRAKGHFSSAIGSSANAEGIFSTALGSRASANKEGSLALGRDSEADKMDGVALGSNAKTDANEGVVGYNPMGNKTANDLLETDEAKTAYQNFTVTRETVEAAEKAMLATRSAYYEIEDKRVENEKAQLRANEEFKKVKESLGKNDISEEEKTKLNTQRTEIINTYRELLSERKELDKQSQDLANTYTEESNSWEKARNDLMKARETIGKEAGAWISTASAVSVGNAEKGITRQLNNLAAGTKDTDAVNVAQLKAIEAKVASGGVETARQFEKVDNQFRQLDKRLNKMTAEYRSGIAGSNAMAGVPTVQAAGESIFGLGVGSFKGESAVAAGYSTALKKGKVVVKFNASINSRGDIGTSGGVGWKW